MDNAKKCLRDMLEHLGINSSDVEFMELKKNENMNIKGEIILNAKN